MRISAGSLDHDQLGGVSTDDHHAIQHAIDSGASHTGDITNTQHGTISQANAHAHSNLSGVTSDLHHAQAHTLASHSSEAHSELSGVGINDHHTQSHTHGSHTSVGANDHHALTHSSTHVPGGADTMAVDAAVDVGSLRTLGTGSVQALPGNSSFAKVNTGTYTGDGSTDEEITGVGFLPKFVKMWDRQVNTNQATRTYQTTTNIQADNVAGGTIWNYPYGSIGDATSHGAIISLDADGFSVSDQGSNQHPNKSGIVYNYIAIG